MESVILKDKSTYKINTEIYQGPLDLLLRLIEKEELDITKVAMSKVTNPFLAYVRNLKSNQAEEASSFLIIAAKLMQIKSEILLPRPVEREPGEEDPSEELIKQLKLYKRYKEIAQHLKDRNQHGLRTYIRIDNETTRFIDHKLDLSNIEIEDLVKAVETVYLIQQNLQPLGTVVHAPTSTIKDKIKLITNYLQSKGASKFSKILGKNRSRGEIVVTFLAILELIKNFKIKANQEKLFGDIDLESTSINGNQEEFSIDIID